MQSEECAGCCCVVHEPRQTGRVVMHGMTSHVSRGSRAQGNWDPPHFEPEPYPVRDTASEAEAEANGKPQWIGRVSAKQV